MNKNVIRNLSTIAGHQWFRPLILTPQEAEIRRIVI
jgi:hypothetical protein